MIYEYWMSNFFLKRHDGTLTRRISYGQFWISCLRYDYGWSLYSHSEFIKCYRRMLRHQFLCLADWTEMSHTLQRCVSELEQLFLRFSIELIPILLILEYVTYIFLFSFQSFQYNFVFIFRLLLPHYISPHGVRRLRMSTSTKKTMTQRKYLCSVTRKQSPILTWWALQQQTLAERAIDTTYNFLRLKSRTFEKL